MIRTIIFDMDGVLFDTEKIYDEAWKIILKERNVENIDYVLSGCRGLTSEDSEKFIDANFKGRLSGKECLNDLMDKFNEIIEKRGVPIKNGVHELLSYLKRNHYEIGLASSTHEPLVVSHLKEVGIREYFTHLTTGDMVEKGKPEPDIYLKACSKFNRKPEECIAVEDSINGVTAAIRAGMNAIMVPDIVQPTKEIEKQLYKKLNSLLEVKDFLESIN
ncbi:MULTISPECIES: HAD family hydrolase [Clostridium]|uniref:HAD family hydrolase n=1 Tax=Clostridium butyricum TaxID=1492 RepID=A0A6N3GJN0_CLOBU|nr:MULTISPECIES: HAD-IA family hydrolase [Clostridium]AXB83534.1 HAD family hydrolase [Clostridium butyricum]KIU06396.1 phosphorylated carbohydrates phosphatase [Clostridium butyricum]KQB78239.1 carbohydrate phosphatase [Clostridium butyricum]MBA8966239.1 HAD superfamily hydrolase (TIGR01509 family) [Clostridium butyricum]MBA8972696.1 HAD superfamily hydrolase (TIGR01509 family) [Clostridium butyricum]